MHGTKSRKPTLVVSVSSKKTRAFAQLNVSKSGSGVTSVTGAVSVTGAAAQNVSRRVKLIDSRYF